MNNLSLFEDRFFDDMLSPLTSGWWENTSLSPAADVEETETHFLISMDVPGVSKEDIQIELTGNQLRVSAERKPSRSEKEPGYRLVERRYGKWERYFRIPESVDGSKIEAHYENGVLALAVPKAESAKPRQIKLQEGRTGFFGRLLGKDGTENVA